MDNNDGIFLSRNKPLKCIKVFDESENVGIKISYRCINCRNCPECKKCLRLEARIIQEDIEQRIVDRNAKVDIVCRVMTAALSFVTNPDLRSGPNESLALRIYTGQARKLNSRPADTLAVIQSENKLQQLEFVDIPWHAVWNEKSISTPVD